MADAAIANAYVQLMPSMKGFSSEVAKAIDAEHVGENSGKSIGAAIGTGLKATGKAIGAGLVAGTAAATVGLQQSVGAARDFEAAMAQVAATGGVSMEQLNARVVSTSSSYGDFTGNLSEFAQFMGSSTAFSASQAAEALNYMALAGYDAQKSVDMLPSVLDLAAAGNIDLAYASDMVTDASSALGLDMEQTARMVDQMATASANSNTSVAQLGEAFLTVGGTAKTLSGGTTELSTALGILADNGIKGAEGGTALRNIILSLGSPTDIAADKMHELGLEVYDAEGKMRPLNDVFGDLDSTLATMTDAERTEVLSTLFNKVDLKSVNALLANSGERFDELSAAIDDCQGAASRMAETQLDNLEGDVTIFKSALEGLEIEVGSRITPTLRTFVKTGTTGLSSLTDALKEGGVSGAVSQLDDVFRASVVTIGSMAGKTDEVWAAFDAADGAAAKVRSAFKTASPVIGSTALLARSAFGTASAAVGAFVKAASPAKDAVASLFGRKNDPDSPASKAASLASNITTLAAKTIGLTADAESLGTWLGERFAGAAETATDVVGRMSDRVGEVDFAGIADKARDFASSAGEALSAAGERLSGAWEGASAVMSGTVLPALSGVADYITTNAIPAVESFAGDPVGSLKSAFESAKGKAGEFADEAVSALETRFPGATSTAQTVADSFEENFGGTWGTIKETFSGVWGEITGGLEDEGFSSAVDTITGKFETLGPLVEGAAGVLSALATESIPFVQSAIETYNDTVSPVREAVVDAAANVMPSLKEGVENLAEPIGNVFDALDNSEVVDSVKGFIESAGEHLPGLVESASTLSGGVLDGIASAVETAAPHVSDLVDSATSFVDNNAPKLEEFIDNISPVMEPLGNALGSVAGGVADLARGVVDFSSDAAGNILDFANGVDWDAVGKDVEGFGAAVGSLGTAIGDGLKDGDFTELNDWIDTYILNPIADAGTSIGTDIGDWWESNASGPVGDFVSNVSGAWDDITTDAGEKWETIKNGLGTTWESIKENAEPAWTSIQGFIQDPIGSAKDAITGPDGFASKIASKLNDMGVDQTTIQTLFSKVGTLISDPIGTAKTAITDPAGFAASIASTLNDMGIDTSGIDSVFSSVGSFMSDPIGTARDTITGAISTIRQWIEDIKTWLPGAVTEINEWAAQVNTSNATVENAYSTYGVSSRTSTILDHHAAGGIFTGPHVGLIGEAGAEAVVPLSNRAYVRPFARAVADEFEISGGSSMSTYNVTINLQPGADASATSLAYSIASALEPHLRMRGAYGRV